MLPTTLPSIAAEIVLPLKLSARWCQELVPSPATVPLQRGELAAGVVAHDRPGAGVTDLKVVGVDAGRAEGLHRADAPHQLDRAGLFEHGVGRDRVVAPAQVAADGVRVRAAIPFDRLDRSLLADAPA